MAIRKPFDESKISRGQPENSGQFGPGGGAKKADEATTSKEPSPVSRFTSNKGITQHQPREMDRGWHHETGEFQALPPQEQERVKRQLLQNQRVLRQQLGKHLGALADFSRSEEGDIDVDSPEFQEYKRVQDVLTARLEGVREFLEVIGVDWLADELREREQAAAARAATAKETATDPATPERQAGKQRLSKTNITSYRSMKKSGRNGSFMVKLADGSMAVYKPANAEDPKVVRDGIKPGTYYRREAAASHVAEIMGMEDLVPLTTLRGDASIQAFVQKSKEGGDLSRGARFDGPEDLARAAALDFVLGNSDRHRGNWMVQGNFIQRRRGQGKIQLIDNGLTLSTSSLDHKYGTGDLEDQAHQKNLPIPRVDGSKRPELERTLLADGIEEQAVHEALKRFDVLVHNQGKTFSALAAHRGGLATGFQEPTSKGAFGKLMDRIRGKGRSVTV